MALQFQLKWPNLQKRLRELSGVSRAALKPFAAEMFKGGLQILRDSKEKAPSVPVDTGALRSSGHVDPPKSFSSGLIKVVIGYGGVPAPFLKSGSPRVDYAVIVHEDLKAKHTTPSTAGAKFVITHINRRRKEQENALIAVLDRVIKQQVKRK